MAQESSRKKLGFRGVIRNFTPSWFIITMSTGVTSILLHQIPYHAHWLDIISEIFFVLNIVLFLLFTLISVLRYTLYPHLIAAVLRHPHQSLFLATFPIGLGTIINMIVLVCVPAWGQGLAIFAWVLWWIDSVLALVACFHLAWVIMSNRRAELAEMTALYFIPILSTVIAAASGALVAGALTNTKHQLWTLVISYVLWGIGTPLSWIILTIYFLRLTVHRPLEREVIVSLLLPIGPLGLSGFSLIALGKVARHSFAVNDVIPKVAHAGDFFYMISLVVGIILWGFALVWFIVAIIMIVTAFPFPFNMGWWGFVFPVGVFTLLTISIGEEFEFKFFKILSCVLTGACVLMWLIIAARTVKRAASGKMFFAPCLGTDLFLKRDESDAMGPGKV
ncbi:voltage-dependent anion channel [Clohesyomyces aquaticus]|uniref:Sulfite efflux pump SSU1 n=1 Tax=Clohesyomyces aquaticus TaxID=1231657 RepID=A0A1Y2A447_9PLEO|nr:voltage-dependent anion channel [Clohesyomyces aquaticus]